MPGYLVRTIPFVLRLSGTLADPIVLEFVITVPLRIGIRDRIGKQLDGLRIQL
jgi:hypothetical protein